MRSYKLIKKWNIILFIASLLMFIIPVFLPIEFQDIEVKLYYRIGITIITTALILLSLYWIVPSQKNYNGKLLAWVLIPLTAFLWFIVLGFFSVMSTFGIWVDRVNVYRHKSHPYITLRSQYLDAGTFGTSGTRTVKITPVLGVWNYVEHVNLDEIDFSDWEKVTQNDLLR